MKLTDTCNSCGFETTMDDGKDVRVMLAAMTDAHDLLRPECEFARKRAAADLPVPEETQ